MKNPFTVIVNNSLSFFDIRKLFLKQEKNSGTKKETGRSKSGGGSINLSSGVVDIDQQDSKIRSRRCGMAGGDVLPKKWFQKRKTKMKIARKSRMSNRLHAKYA
jgi:hypothetical protein